MRGTRYKGSTLHRELSSYHPLECIEPRSPWQFQFPPRAVFAWGFSATFPNIAGIAPYVPERTLLLGDYGTNK